MTNTTEELNGCSRDEIQRSATGTQITRLILVDDIAGRYYEKRQDGRWMYRMRPWPSGMSPRKGLERHKAAELNRQLLQRAITEKVETPKKPPASFNKLFNAAREYFMPLNLVLSKQDLEGIVIFHRRDPIGTISLESLEHLIERLVIFRSEYVLWKEEKKRNPQEEERGNLQEEY